MCEALRAWLDEVVAAGGEGLMLHHGDALYVARRSDASKLFQAPIRLMEGEWGYRFDAKWLELPVVQNKESVEEFLHQAPACLLVKYRDQASLTERIRRMLRRYLAEEMPSLEAISDMLATTPQTLRRRLQRIALRRRQGLEGLAQLVAAQFQRGH